MLRIYSDITMNQEIYKLEWDASFILQLINGEKVTLKNTAQQGQTASATVYLKNDGLYRFAVTNLDFPDKRVKINIEDAWLIPHLPVRLTAEFTVPKNVTPKDVVKPGVINIKGYYVYGE